MTFANPLSFFLLLLLIPMTAWYVTKFRKAKASLRLSSLDGFGRAPDSFRNRIIHAPFVFRFLAFTLLVIAMARPQTTDSWNKQTTEGIDIVMSIDISTSMLAMDLKPNRLEAAKDVAASFINGRPTDNISLVVFARESFTQCPLTTDHAVLLNLLKEVKTGIITDGTAIGHGLATAISRLKDSDAKSKVIILLTDGTNNAGEIAPVTASEIAREFNIRVYTIGVGTKGEAPYPYPTPTGTRIVNVPVEIDEQSLTQIAQTTGGLYFRADNNAALKNIYQEIDKLEKTKMNVQEFSEKYEQFAIFALLAFLCFLIELILRYTVLRSNP
ncbi:MAG: VWA domain-containing protein [Dysgonamonadaceae bacterium]|jgi:Ca-activated chloride channel family protein|nr:VWA domain-containing protein [Dysgonamonadaceae bacterium]